MELLGEIHEIPTGTMRLIRKWEVFNEKGTLNEFKLNPKGSS